MNTYENCHEIIPNLFLGNYLIANDIEFLKSLGITHILNCSIEHPMYFPNEFVYLHLPIHDIFSQNILQYLNETYEFINKSTRVYVHCHAGISRSSSITIAYLMKKYSINFQKALKYVQSIRKIVEPNEGFQIQLECYEDEVFRSI